MAVYFTEFGGFASGRPQTPGIASGAPIQGQTASSATTSTGFFSGATRMVRVVADAAGWFLPTGSSVSTTVATSTNSLRIAPNVPGEYFYVQPNSRFTLLST